jgi:hypothetical protein
MGLKRDGDRFSYATARRCSMRSASAWARSAGRARTGSFFERPARAENRAQMATVLTRVPLLKDCGYDYTKVVHGEQRLTLHRPLPPEGELIADARA